MRRIRTNPDGTVTEQPEFIEQAQEEEAEVILTKAEKLHHGEPKEYVIKKPGSRNRSPEVSETEGQE